MNKGRDLLSIYSKLVQVLYPRRTQGREVLKLMSFLPTYFVLLTHAYDLSRDWDLWGPLILCLLLGIMLSVNVCPPPLTPVHHDG